MRFEKPRDPHGRALLDYFNGDGGATIVVHSDLGERDELPVAIFFRSPDGFFPFDLAALARCRGRVLDVGAGTGVHSLYLQERGFDVCAIDVMPEAVQIMRTRGLRDVRLAALADLEGETFDTILMMMNGIGILGTLEGLDRFLRDAPRLLGAGGQILLDSGPPSLIGDPDDHAVQMRAGDAEGYYGETWIELEYRGVKGPPFRELYADADTLCRHAESAGWDVEIIHVDEHGGYVARLTRSDLTMG